MSIPIVYWPLEYTLRVNGLWPEKTHILGPIATASGLVVILPFQLWNALSLTDKPALFFDSLSDITTEMVLYIKLIIMWFNKRYIIAVLREISNDYYRNKMTGNWLLHTNNARRFCKYDYSLYVSATILYYVQIVSVYAKTPVGERVMVLKSYYPFDYQSSPNYEILTLVQVFIAVLMATANAMTECFFVVLILHTCHRVDVLLDEVNLFSLKHEKKSRDNSETNVNIRICLRRVLKKHHRVLDFVKKIELIYAYVSLVQIFFSVISICITGFVVITALKSKEIVLLIKFATFIWSLLWQILSICFGAQYLLNKGDSISEAVYNSYWYKVDLHNMKAIVFIMKKAQYPLSITAGKLMPLSVPTFTAVIKTSFTYLSVLRATYV